jgi:UbiD family decarboxylase
LVKFIDLREYLNLLEEKNLLRIVEGVDWYLEIGAITELMALSKDPKALLFDSIKDYPKGFRVATCLYASEYLQSLALGLPTTVSPLERVKIVKEIIKSSPKLGPKEVSEGPILENVVKGEEVNVLVFPAPYWRKGDGGRYIGTGDCVIMRDLDEGWVNLGVYRVMVVDKKTLAMYIVPGHHGLLIAQKYWRRGSKAPVAIVLGQEPVLFFAAAAPLPWGYSEYEFAGGFKGEPIKVIVDDETLLPIPATAEAVILGHIPPPESASIEEGPFGECTGYYSGRYRGLVVQVSKILYRNDPIIHGVLPMKGSIIRSSYLGAHILTAALIWNSIEREVPGIKGVYPLYQICQTGPSVVAISIEQMYPGHAKHAALAVLSSQASARFAKVIVVVDDDIDVTNIEDVMWALATRVDPERDVQIVRGIPGFSLDPSIPEEKKRIQEYTSSVVIIDATKKPYAMKEKYPQTITIDTELKRKVLEKFRNIFS